MSILRTMSIFKKTLNQFNCPIGIQSSNLRSSDCTIEWHLEMSSKTRITGHPKDSLPSTLF